MYHTASQSKQLAAFQMLRFLCGFVLTTWPLVILVLGPGPTSAVYVSPEDMEDAFEEATQKYDLQLATERRLRNSGGIIAKGTVSAETRHQGKGGTKLSQEMNSADALLQFATQILKTKKSLSAWQVENELPKLDLQASKSPRAAKAYAACAKTQETPPCDENSPYRTQDGSCNNLKNPTWGRANVCFRRLMPVKYSDGISEPRKSEIGQPLPNPRVVSRQLHRDLSVDDSRISLMVMQWGQFVDHDLNLAPMVKTKVSRDTLECCPIGNNVHPACIPIPIPKDDDFFGPLGKDCMSLVRSSGCSQNCSLGPRNVVNVLTSFLDGSQIYGSSQEELDALREDYGGLLKIQAKPDGEFLPAVSLTEDNQCTKEEAGFNCYAAGDERVNEHPGLTSMHTVWLREHNRIARELKRLNGRLTDEQLFQETRRIVVAEIQHITYQHFLPVLLGPDFTSKYRLSSASQSRTYYSPTVDPTILTDFSTAAYRMGHTLIQNNFLETGSGAVGDVSLRDNFFNQEVMTTGQMSPLLAGITGGPAQSFDPFMAEAVTNHLYKVTGSKFGLDLVAINIQRGRDHGIGSYGDYVQTCSGRQIRESLGFGQLDGTVQSVCSEKLPKIYKNVCDVDFFTGGVCENPVANGVVGPTFACVIGQQFKNLKDGDRFFYQHASGNGVKPFTDAQLTEIWKVSLSGVLCANAKTKYINENAFLAESRLLRCDKIPTMKLSVFV